MNKLPDNPLVGIVSALFIGTWIILGIGTLIASWRLSAAVKRRWLPRMVILVGVLFVFFSATLTVLESRSWSSLGFLVVIVPVIALVSYLNIKFIEFCDNCNATLYNQNWFVPRRYCSKCGAKLIDSKPLHGDDLL